MDNLEVTYHHLQDFIKSLKYFAFSHNEIIHACSILLRAYNEVCYMYDSSKSITEFSISQMEHFMVRFRSEVLTVYIDNFAIKFLTLADAHIIIEEFYDYLNSQYPFSYDFRNIDPIYFSLFFYDVLDKIQNIEFDTMNISDFRLLRKNSSPVSLNESETWKALVSGQHTKIFTPFPSNHIIDSDKDRLEQCFESIKIHGYPFQNRYIILYNDEPYIRDGQHRACIIKYLWGNIDVPVLRFVLKNHYFYD